jgi:peptidoglycan/LPS O-acetylase OafA/YrhL
VRPTPRVDGRRPLSRLARAVGIIGWASFLAASLATMLCFAFLDPQSFLDGDAPPWWGPRMRVYAIGFFFFWFVGVAAATLAWLLARRPRTR